MLSLSLQLCFFFDTLNLLIPTDKLREKNRFSVSLTAIQFCFQNLSLHCNQQKIPIISVKVLVLLNAANDLLCPGLQS